MIIKEQAELVIPKDMLRSTDIIIQNKQMLKIIDLFGKVIEQNSQNMISLIQEYKSGDDNDVYINSTCRDNSRYAYNYNF